MKSNDDFSQCLMFNARMASRALSRRYERLVRPLGIKSGQFSVLVLVMNNTGKNMSELADLVSMDRTTLLRNLALLEQKTLVEPKPMKGGGGRTYVLTARGEEVLSKAVPLWRQVQADVQSEMGADEFQAAIDALRKLSRL